MAFRLSKWLGRTPESRLHIQNSYDLWHAKQKIDLSEIEPLEFQGSGGVRDALNVSQSEFAMMIGVSVRTLQNWTRKKKTRWTCKSLVTCCLKKSQSGT